MNKQRMIVLGVAVIAAGGAALMARSLMGGGTPQVKAAPPPPTIAMSQVLVASQPLQPGDALTPAQVHWEKWPSASVDPSFVTQNGSPDLNSVVKGMVVRAPMVAGEPLAAGKYVKGDASSFMAATLQPGMRAMAIQVAIATVAGGFIQPNDRVDIILTRKIGDTRIVSRAILSDIRVLAIDQAANAAKDQKAVADAKTATLELTPAQAVLVSGAGMQGTLSLSLRSLSENLPDVGALASATGTPTADQVRAAQARLNAKAAAQQPDSVPSEDEAGDASQVKIIRYGVQQKMAPSDQGGEAK